jgi:hypothetical protein
MCFQVSIKWHAEWYCLVGVTIAEKSTVQGCHTSCLFLQICADFPEVD